ncbi:MAG: CDP-glycerol glycerophosphotransferase family protein [Rhodanobacteraceae bacterium]
MSKDEDIRDIKQRVGLSDPENGKIVLFAPTRRHDAVGRSMYPFGMTADEFLHCLSEVAEGTRSTIVVRAHLKTGIEDVPDYPRIVWRPLADYPDTEAILLASDMLVCDWSSIAFDWLLLDRPTVFLDVKPPFAKGHTLDASYRFGALVGDMRTLQESLRRFLAEPDAYHERYDAQAARIREAVFGGSSDGLAAERCIRCLQAALSSDHV